MPFHSPRATHSGLQLLGSLPSSLPPHLIPPRPSWPSLCLPSRKVLNKLNFSVPEDVMRKIVQCAPGVVELVLIPLRQRLEERKRRKKQGVGSLQVPPLSRFSQCSEGASQAVEASPWR